MGGLTDSPGGDYYFDYFDRFLWRYGLVRDMVTVTITHSDSLLNHGSLAGQLISSAGQSHTRALSKK